VDGEVGSTQPWEYAQIAIQANDIERFALNSYTDAPAFWGVDWSRVNLGFVSGQGGLLTPGELPDEIDLADWTIADQLLISGWNCSNPPNCSNHRQQWIINADVTTLLNLPLRPEIDIKPDGDLNSINPGSRGVIPVAVLGSDSFDVADVDVTTLAFGPAGASLANRHGPHFEDLDGDGLTDLRVHFRIEESGIAFGDITACLTGETVNGSLFEGCDAVRTVPGADSIRSSTQKRRRSEPAP
jgi:hypothetical protein